MRFAADDYDEGAGFSGDRHGGDGGAYASPAHVRRERVSERDISGG
jgi:hypothetical protein